MCCVGKDCASWHNRPLPYQTCGFSAFNLTLSCDFNRVCCWNRHVVLWHCCWLFLLSHGWSFKGPSCVLLVSTDYWRTKAILTMESLQKWATKVYSFSCTCWKWISLKTGCQLSAALGVGVLSLAQAWLFLCVLQGPRSPNWHLLCYSRWNPTVLCGRSLPDLSSAFSLSQPLFWVDNKCFFLKEWERTLPKSPLCLGPSVSCRERDTGKELQSCSCVMNA